MMFRIVILLLILQFTFGQDHVNTPESLKICESIQASSFSSEINADNILNQILEVTGLSKNFSLSPCSEIKNAIAVSFKGTRYILYDPNFMSLLSSNTSNWTSVFILAHEIGHHVNGHSIDVVLFSQNIVEAPVLLKKRQQELEADQFAAFVLAKLGANLNDAIDSVSMISDNDDIYSTHPRRSKREEAIKKGYRRANKSTRLANNIIDSPSTTINKNIISTYETYNIKWNNDSIVNTWSNDSFLISHKIYENTSLGHLLRRELSFFDDNWDKGVKLNDNSKDYIRIKEKVYRNDVYKKLKKVNGKLIEEKKFRLRRWLEEEIDKFAYSDSYSLSYITDGDEAGYIRGIDGEFVQYFPEGNVKSYSVFKNDVTKQYTSYHYNGEIKKIENVYDQRSYDGRLDKLIHQNGTIMMEFAPIYYYWENDSGTVYHDNGQVFFEYRVIPENILSDLTKRGCDVESRKEDDPIKKYCVPILFIRYYTNRMYHKNGQIFAKLNFNNYEGSTFTECYDEKGNLTDCKKYSNSVREHLLNVLDSSEIQDLNFQRDRYKF